MELRSNTERLAIRFAPYIQELHEFFRSRGLFYGSPRDIVSLAEALGSPGSFHDEMMSMLRSVIFRERGVVPRNELLELILIASGGAEIDLAAQEVIAPVADVNEFVSEVLQSLKRKTFLEEDEPVEAEADAAMLSSLDSGDHIDKGEAARVDSAVGKGFAGEAEWNVEPPSEQHAVFLPLAGAYAGAQTSSSQFEEPGEGRDGRALPPEPRILDAAELAVVPRVAAALPPQPFFRHTMFALCLALAATLAWRHWDPVGIVQPQASRVAVAAGPAPVSSAHSIAGGLSAESTGLHQSPTPLNRTSSPGEVAGAAGATPSASSPQGTDDLVGVGAQGSVAAKPPPSVPASGPKSESAGDGAVPPVPGRRRSTRQPQRAAAPPAAGRPPSAANKQGVSVVSSGVMDGNLLTSSAPKYPMMASMAGVEGQVILQAVVSRNGTVVATHVLAGHHLLRGAAVHAVRSWRYRPYVVRGKPADVATIVIVDFHLPH